MIGTSFAPKFGLADRMSLVYTALRHSEHMADLWRTAVRKSKILLVAEALGALIAVATLVYLFIQIDYYKDRLAAYQAPHSSDRNERISSDVEQESCADTPSGKASGQWHLTQFIVKSDYDPYLDLKLQYILDMQVSEDCSISGVGEKTHEAERELPRDRRSSLTVSSGRFVDDRAVLNIHEEDYRGKKSYVVMTVILVSSNEFVGYARSSVANTFALVYGDKR